MDGIFELIINPSVAFFSGLATGIFLYWLFGLSKAGKDEKTLKNSENIIENSFSEGSGVTKMVLVVRNDLKMGKGKAAAQCAHGAVMAHEIVARKKPIILKDWKQSGQKKIVLKAESESELLQLANEAKKVGLVHAIVQDAGLTQILSGSRTVLAVGPGPEDVIDKVTSHLKLY